MLKHRRLLRRDIAYASAKEEEVNILQQLGYYDKQARFFSHLNNHHAFEYMGRQPHFLTRQLQLVFSAISSQVAWTETDRRSVAIVAVCAKVA